MKKPFWGALVVVVAVIMAGSAVGQDEKKPSAAEKRMEAINLELRAAMNEARAEQRAKVDAWRKAAEKAKAEGKEAPAMPAMRMGPPTEILVEYLGKFEAAAIEFAGTDDAIMFLSQVISLGGYAEEKERALAAAKSLLDGHMKSEKLGEALMAISFGERTFGKDKVAAMLDRVVAESPHADVKARAIFVPVMLDLAQAPVGSDKYEAAKVVARKALKMAQGEDLRAEILSGLEGREKTAPGKTAPDIVGVDLDGVEFKLSEYKGKIILLDFWGNW